VRRELERGAAQHPIHSTPTTPPQLPCHRVPTWPPRVGLPGQKSIQLCGCDSILLENQHLEVGDQDKQRGACLGGWLPGVLGTSGCDSLDCTRGDGPPRDAWSPYATLTVGGAPPPTGTPDLPARAASSKACSQCERGRANRGRKQTVVTNDRGVGSHTPIRQAAPTMSSHPRALYMHSAFQVTI
jgi:hypothetical protein